MNYETVIAVCVAIVGWFTINYFAQRRDRLSKRREMRAQYLVDAYRTLESVSNRKNTFQEAAKFESAVADIQLFGTKKQVL